MSFELSEQKRRVATTYNLDRYAGLVWGHKPPVDPSAHEIAAALTVSDETVKTHVGNILTKLQLAHRTQAVIYALKKGIISLDEIELP